MSDDQKPSYYGAGAHSHSENWDVVAAREKFAEAQAEAKARHQAHLAERKAKREALKAIARQEGGFIGPPNPWRLRKGRPPMTTTKG